jgi:hypothetical protein
MLYGLPLPRNAVPVYVYMYLYRCVLIAVWGSSTSSTSWYHWLSECRKGPWEEGNGEITDYPHIGEP